MIDDDSISETVRLENRVLDLRRPPMQNNLRMRHRAAMATRKYLDSPGFIDTKMPSDPLRENWLSHGRQAGKLALVPIVTKSERPRRGGISLP